MESQPEPLVVTCPKRLRTVGYIFFFIGVSSVTDAAFSLVSGHGGFDIAGLLCLPAGFMVARGTATWRGFMLFVSGTAILAAVVGVGVVIYMGLTGRFMPYPAYPMSFAVTQAVVATGFVIVFGLVFGWALRVLLSQECYNWSHRPPVQVVKIEHSTNVGLALTAVLALVLTTASWGAARAIEAWEDTCDSGQTAVLGVSEIGGLSYGTRFGKLVYVVLQHKSSGSMTPAVHEGEDRSGMRAGIWIGNEKRMVFEAPDGKEIDLPNETQLYEIVDGKFRSSPERVTKEQLDAFLASNPKRYTIDALLAFTKTGKPGLDNSAR